MGTPITMFKKLCQEIQTKFINTKLDSGGKVREWRRKINNIGIWNMRYLENYSTKFSQHYYKLGIMKPI